MFRPQYIFDRIWDIPFEFFADNRINAVFLDVDNTLTTHDAPELVPSATTSTVWASLPLMPSKTRVVSVVFTD